jgi:hypothetical protein
MRFLATVAFTCACAAAQDKPIPRMQAIPLPHHQVSFQYDEKELARYHFGPDLMRPFVFPVIGPSGRALTRMGHPGDPDTHSHHNSVWIGLSSVDGRDFWSDQGGRIRHLRTVHLEDGDRAAWAITEAEWIPHDGPAVLRERRGVFVKLLTGGEWLLLLDLQLKPAGVKALIDKASFGPIGVRVAKTIGTFHGGGRLRNSEGAAGEEELFRRPAHWVDYSGQVAAGVVEGLTLMDHPSNPRHPAPFHVREDGWMGATLALEEPYEISAGKPLHLLSTLLMRRPPWVCQSSDSRLHRKRQSRPSGQSAFGGCCSWGMTERECANGRRRYRSRQEAEQRAADFAASGLTQQEFCERNEVSRSALARYLKRHWQRAAAAPRQWVAVEIAAPGATGSRLWVVLRGGQRIEVGRGFDAATLRQLVTALEGR